MGRAEETWFILREPLHTQRFSPKQLSKQCPDPVDLSTGYPHPLTPTPLVGSPRHVGCKGQAAF